MVTGAGATARLPGYCCQGLGESTCRPGSRALTAGAPGCGRAAGRRGRHGLAGGRGQVRGGSRAGAGRLAGKGLVRGPRRPAGPQAPTVSERLAASAALSLSHRPRRESRLTCSAAPDAAAAAPRSGEPPAEHIMATPARWQRQRGRGFPRAPLPAGSRTARRPRPRCVTAAPGARTPRGGACVRGGACAWETVLEGRAVPQNRAGPHVRGECQK